MKPANLIQETSLWGNPLFLSLMGIVLFLLIVIIVLADVVKGSALIAKDSPKSTAKKLGIIIFLFIASSYASFAEGMANATATAAVPANSAADTFNGLGGAVFYTLVAAIVVELLVIIVLVQSIRVLLGISERKALEASENGEVEEAFPMLLDKMNASVAIEEESSILMDHEYDGIRELDNDLPPGWKYGFYVTIVFACVYIYIYHISHSSELQAGEYNKEMAQAEQDLANFRKNSASAIDENNVKLLTDAESLAKGKELFHDNCAPCHNQQGQGLVGPNLTDDYWLHGGSIKDIFNTIKYGWPEKGMKSWKDDFSGGQIALLASYIKSIHGTNPPNPKEKQGELYTETTASTSSNDSSKVAKADTNKVKVEVK